VALLMVLWPLMVAFSEVAAIALIAVAVFALGVLAVDALRFTHKCVTGSRGVVAQDSRRW
jgi:hypothetical protein